MVALEVELCLYPSALGDLPRASGGGFGMSGATGHLGDRLVFVVGARRSGTNWLQRVLCAHPDIAGTNGESFFFTRGLVPLMQRFHHGSPASMVVGSVFADRDRVIDGVRDLCDVVFGDLLGLADGAKLLVDRTPENVECLQLIGEIYPEAKVLHIIRDGRDVVRSLLSMDWGTDDARVAAMEWRRAVVEGRRVGQRLRHYHEVRYEGLLADPAGTFPQVFESLGMTLDGSTLEAVLAESNQGFFVDPRMPTIAAGKWRDGLDPVALAVLEDVAGDALRELGYLDEDAPSSPTASGRRRRRGSELARQLGHVRFPRRSRSAQLRDPDASKLSRDLADNHSVVLRFLSAMATGELGELAGMLDDRLVFRVVGDPAGGPASGGASELLAALSCDPVLQWAQRSGEHLAGVPTSTVFLCYERPDGGRAERALAITVDDGKVRRVTLLRPSTE